jgi:hypothetical protein
MFFGDSGYDDGSIIGFLQLQLYSLSTHLDFYNNEVLRRNSSRISYSYSILLWFDWWKKVRILQSFVVPGVKFHFDVSYTNPFFLSQVLYIDFKVISSDREL